MKVSELTSTYRSPLREEQKEATRQRILDAAGKLLEDSSLKDLSFAVIAEMAGVKERTVYRHFPNKDALLEGIWGWYQSRIRYGPIVGTEEELLAQPLRTFPAFEENEQVARALWLSPQGREFRLSNVEDRKKGIKSAVADAIGGLPPREARWIAAVMHLLNSGAAMWTMKDYWGFSGEEAGKASALAMELLLTAARERARRNSKNRKG